MGKKKKIVKKRWLHRKVASVDFLFFLHRQLFSARATFLHRGFFVFCLRGFRIVAATGAVALDLFLFWFLVVLGHVPLDGKQKREESEKSKKKPCGGDPWR